MLLLLFLLLLLRGPREIELSDAQDISSLSRPYFSPLQKPYRIGKELRLICHGFRETDFFKLKITAVCASITII